MTAAAIPAVAIPVGANPFSRRAVLAIVLIGVLLFVALLWMIGTGNGIGSTNDGQAHAGGKGLNGYAAMADYLERRGFPVRKAKNEGALDKPGLLVLTPPAHADGEAIEKIVSARRYTGATMVITPKWMAAPPAREQTGAKKGWVRIVGAMGPNWPGFLDDVSVSIEPVGKEGSPARWHGMGLTGTLPAREQVLSGKGDRLAPLVAGPDGRILAALLDDGGHYPMLEDLAVEPMQTEIEDEDLYPLIIVFEPDLLDNYGMASLESARLAEKLVRASGIGAGEPVIFDMTLNGFGQTDNLLTLAFTPPFLAATLCLLLAALIVGWRAFLRFGPPLASARAIAFGKRALVANAGSFLRRSGRLHLMAGPYSDRARERLARGLGLPRHLDTAHAEAAIDRALASRDPDAEPFSMIVARLRQARKPHDLLKAARDLHALERMLAR
ncbi:hypothetical protein GCM10011494_29720 [Novosphingobium endophyticum]|uniref:DUF4350 domain-containing protein n=1 Tax=Novosphingobium endophyticum TaxID=1955250 RepID=A0A916TUJ9_9SPHN|nr:DUF4350 domain-containing protein [Novosphingobium endophyticum]GGC09115.1 hypothetical protein GCM10011494_29720 [Novosphingobium endophyticum]